MIHFFPPGQPSDQIHRLLSQLLLIIADRRQPGIHQAGGRNAVKTGDNDILRHPVSVFLQGVADGNGHDVIGAENGVGQLFPLLNQLQRDGCGRLGPILAGGDVLLQKRQAEFREHLPVAPEAELGVFLSFLPGDEKGIPGAVIPDYMAKQCFESVSRVVDDIVATRMRQADADNGHMVRSGVGDDFIKEFFIMEAVRNNHQPGKQVVADSMENTPGDPAVFLIPVEIQRTVKHNQFASAFPGGAVQLRHITGVQIIMQLRQADSDNHNGEASFPGDGRKILFQNIYEKSIPQRKTKSKKTAQKKTQKNTTQNLRAMLEKRSGIRYTAKVALFRVRR